MISLLREKSFWFAFFLLFKKVLSIADFEHVGCFKDKFSDRALPKLLAEFPQEQTLQQRIQKCADTAKKRGYTVFGVQYQWECWSGPNAEETYDKYGRVIECVNGLGASFANDVYKMKICRHVIFKKEAENGKTLFDHSLGEHLVISEDQCRVQCFLNHDCVSYNLGPSPTPGLLLCELNNADRYQHPHDYQDKPGFYYTGTKNACNTNPCMNGATCKIGYGGDRDEPFRCVCPAGFKGEHCKKG